MITGRRFTRWKVLAPRGSKFWLCRCDCGTEKEVRKDQLVRGVSKSCGCLKAEVAREQIIRLSTTHGLSKTKTHKVWKDMRKRCNNPNCKSYPSYGGRGIRVCDRWESFSKFLYDMGDVPDGMTIDRINNDGNYEPSNCRWATRKEQSNNKQNTLLYRLNGETRTLKSWCEKFDLPYHRVYQRIFRLHWSFQEAIMP